MDSLGIYILILLVLFLSRALICTYASSLGIMEVESEGQQIQGQSGLHSEAPSMHKWQDAC